MKKDEIKNVLDKHPSLSRHGLGGSVRDFQELRAALLNDEGIDECSRAERWLTGREHLKSYNPKWTSYGWKHEAEKQVGYISNGAFIVAALHLGFKMKKDGNSPNPLFNIGDVLIDFDLLDSHIARIAGMPSRDREGNRCTKREELLRLIQHQAGKKLSSVFDPEERKLVKSSRKFLAERNVKVPA